MRALKKLEFMRCLSGSPKIVVVLSQLFYLLQDELMTGSEAQAVAGSGVLPASSNPLALPPACHCKFQAKAPRSPL